MHRKPALMPGRFLHPISCRCGPISLYLWHGICTDLCCCSMALYAKSGCPNDADRAARGRRGEGASHRDEAGWHRCRMGSRLADLRRLQDPRSCDPQGACTYYAQCIRIGRVSCDGDMAYRPRSVGTCCFIVTQHCPPPLSNWCMIVTHRLTTQFFFSCAASRNIGADGASGGLPDDTGFDGNKPLQVRMLPAVSSWPASKLSRDVDEDPKDPSLFTQPVQATCDDFRSSSNRMSLAGSISARNSNHRGLACAVRRSRRRWAPGSASWRR